MQNSQDTGIGGNLISIQVSKEFTALFKFYLDLLAELHLPEEQYNALRKKILNISNDTIRNTLQFLDFFDFVINADKVKEATTRVTYKKSIFCPPVII